MTKTLNSIEEMVTHKKNKASDPSSSENQQPADDHDIWAKLLASKVRRMNEDVGDEFKLQVDTMALQFLQKWHVYPWSLLKVDA